MTTNMVGGLSALLPEVFPLLPPSLTSKLEINNEEELIKELAYLMMFFGACAFIALMFVPAPYGKHGAANSWVPWGPPMPAKLAWILQELPSFAIPALYWLQAANSSDAAKAHRFTTFNATTALLAMFLIHYANRTFIFPMRIRGGKPTPVGVFAMAFGFCMWNG